MSNFIDRTGQKFGRLTAMHRAKNNSFGQARWVCLCECGSYTTVNATHLAHSRIKSCGCLQREITIANNTKHGNASRNKPTAEYRAWRNMISRCTDQNRKDYGYYGGRGISVCNRWLNSFPDFLSDVGTRPSRNHSIDRINTNGDYAPENVKWSTREEQSNNRRNNIVLELNGESATLAEWARKLKAKRCLLKFRLYRGWSVERTLTEKIA